MGKSPSTYPPEGVFLYRHRVRKDAYGKPLILEADARTAPIIDPETGHQKVDRITGQPQFALANLYGYELHIQLRDQPHIWEDVTADPPAEAFPEPEPEPKKRGRGSTKSTPEEQASDPEPDSDGDSAEQEPAK